MGIRVFITGLGIVSPLGRGRQAVATALMRGERGIGLPQFFVPLNPDPLPVAEIKEFKKEAFLPRTHALALQAARDAMADAVHAPDAVILGITTGGMPDTEVLLKQNLTDPARYRLHATGSVTACVAQEVGCEGPALTVSNACSSGSAALAIALEMLRCGMIRSALAGGADALCRLTYYGFHALQLVDALGARPLDRRRRGMTVGEGAALLFLTAAEDPPEKALGELLGTGLSCDAHHPAAPHPEGLGALQAMREAISDAGVASADIDYINLHGTGTPDNDRAEAMALNRLFGTAMPYVSSTKGATGHALAAAGAIGAAIALIGMREGLIPANSGCDEPDAELKLHPVLKPLKARVHLTLVNAFGFGGNNASLVVGAPERTRGGFKSRPMTPLCIHGTACLTGAGNADATMNNLMAGITVKGIPDPAGSLRNLPQRDIRRLKHLSRLALALAGMACPSGNGLRPPHGVFFGTGWGSLSETHDFLMKLYDSEERFTSPTDFIGSVHNAAAGQVALHYKATGPNMTLSGGDYSFEQALLTASLFSPDPEKSVLVIGADEHHPALSPLLEPAAAIDETPSAGGAAFLLSRSVAGRCGTITPIFFADAYAKQGGIPLMIQKTGGRETIAGRYAAVFAGIPVSVAAIGRRQLEEFLSVTGFRGAVIDYRRWTGEFASASAVAAQLAVQCIQHDEIPDKISKIAMKSLQGRGILILGLGDYLTAIEVMP